MVAYRKTCVWKHFCAWLLTSYASTACAGDLYLSTVGTPGSLGTSGVVNPANTFGATLLISGDAEVDQTAQGVRFAGDFDRNLVLFLGGT